MASSLPLRMTHRQHQGEQRQERRPSYPGSDIGDKPTYKTAASDWLRLVALDLDLILSRLRLRDVVGRL